MRSSGVVSALILLAALGCSDDEPEERDPFDCPPSEDCSADGIECGPVLEGATCVRHCGGCSNPNESCGALAPNQCGCRSETCETRGYECGSFTDQCSGQTMECGQCAAGLTCGGGGMPNVCATMVGDLEPCDDITLFCDASQGLACCGDVDKRCRQVPNGTCDNELPDLAFVTFDSVVTFSQRVFTSTEGCAVSDGCIGAPGRYDTLGATTRIANVGRQPLTLGPGRYDTLGATTRIANVGRQPLTLGNPAQSTAYTASACGMNHYMTELITYRLLDEQDNVVAEANGNVYCIFDFQKADTNLAEDAVFSCDDNNHGLSPGWGYLIEREFNECAFLDITNVPPGTYTFERELNPNRFFEESDYSNNIMRTSSVSIR